MSAIRYACALALALTVLTVNHGTAMAKCKWWNVVCHGAQAIGDIGTAALPDVEAEVSVKHKIENVDELRQLMNETMNNLDGALAVAGGETRQTIQAAISELSQYTRELDGIAGRRIADLDARIYAKLLWMQQYTEEVNGYALNILTVASQEMQTVIGKAGDEARQTAAIAGDEARESLRVAGEEARQTAVVAGAETRQSLHVAGEEARQTAQTAGNEARATIHTAGEVLDASLENAGQETVQTAVVAGDELRYTISTAGQVTDQIVTKLSSEAQMTVAQATAGLAEAVRKTREGLGAVTADVERSSFRIMDGGLYIIERSADMALTAIMAVLGLGFLFIASYGWGRVILRHPLPQVRWLKILTISLMSLTFLVALAPFVFLVPDVRAKTLLPLQRARAYAAVEGLADPRFQSVPLVLGVSPQYVQVLDQQLVSGNYLEINGTNLRSWGLPVVSVGVTELPIIGNDDNRLIVDLTPILQQPTTAERIEVQFVPPDSSGELSTPYSIPIQILEPTPVPEPTRLQLPIETPMVLEFHPDPIVIVDGNLETGGYLEVEGANLLSWGQPRVIWGDTQLEIVTLSETTLRVDLAPVLRDPHAVRSVDIIFAFGTGEPDEVRRYAVLVEHQSPASSVPMPAAPSAVAPPPINGSGQSPATSMAGPSVGASELQPVEQFAEVLVLKLDEFQLAGEGITPQTMQEALASGDAGTRINSLVQGVWGDWLNVAQQNGTDSANADPENYGGLSPFRQLVIKMIQGRQGGLSDQQQCALYSLFTRNEDPITWSNNINGVIGAINRECFN
jgi:hypothetical protein